MKEELLVDLESQKRLLRFMNTTLRKQNRRLESENRVLNKMRLKQFKAVHGSKAIVTGLVLIPLVFFVLNNHDESSSNTTSSFNSKYIVENLQGDIIDTWSHWKLMKGERLAVNIVNAEKLPDDKKSAITEAILSEETLQIDDSLLHKGPQGITSTYYVGWRGALLAAAENPTELYIPTDFVIIESAKGEGEINVILSTEADTDGYSGYTKSITENDQILKSTITVYNVDELSASEIGTIMRHEFGHALGLAHSSAPEDLMAVAISTPYPYISECNVDAIFSLYDGKSSSKVICKK